MGHDKCQSGESTQKVIDAIQEALWIAVAFLGVFQRSCVARNIHGRLTEHPDVATHYTMPTYVITGCSTGIGLELCKQLAARGDKVFATCRKKESSATGVDLISAVTGDVTIVEGIDVMVDDCKAKLAAALAGVSVDVLVCNAGGINGTSALKGGDMGGVPVELSCAGLVKAMDGLTLETTGRYMTVPMDGSDPTDFGPGW
ncbi:hypothetical protein JL720_7027 [Aureococcus anophagefferens]|nr:hypothetical protein JL720_7027 [Aureococcus anophagefferens]